MVKKLVITLTVLTSVMLMIGLAWALVPAPPVNQHLGLPDSIFNELTEPACRYCHNQNPPAGVPVDPTYLPTRHHLLVSATSPVTLITNSDAPCIAPIDTVNFPGMTACSTTSTYACLTCHTFSIVNGQRVANVVRDCTKCHQQTAGGLTVHHRTELANVKGLCATCHGDFVSSIGCKPGMAGATDPSCVNDTPAPPPTYIPSIVTPWPSKKPNGDNSGGGILRSSAGTYPGNCNYCHNTTLGDPGPTVENTGPFAPVDVYRNDITHHNTGFFQDVTKCAWCHNQVPDPVTGNLVYGPPNAMSIRTCQNCHDLKTIHNIQYDSTPVTPVVPGSEPAGNGHVGAQSDCWGCHGNNGQTIGGAAGAEMTTGTVPALYTTSFLTAKAGASNLINLGGIGFQSTDDWNEFYQSKLLLTARIGGASTTIAGGGTSDVLTATVPATLAPGNYKVQAMKDLIGVQKSNPLVIALKPAISITSATCSSGSGTVTIAGSGFHVFENGETTVKGAYNGATLTGQVTSWTNSGITAKFTATTIKKGNPVTTAVCPSNVTVKNVFDSGTKTVTVSGGGKTK